MFKPMYLLAAPVEQDHMGFTYTLPASTSPRFHQQMSKSVLAVTPNTYNLAKRRHESCPFVSVCFVV
jgi:hypothetical protein